MNVKPHKRSDAGRAPWPKGPDGRPLPPTALEEIPGLPAYDPELTTYDPGGFELMWDLVRGLFRRRPHDRAA